MARLLICYVLLFCCLCQFSIPAFTILSDDATETPSKISLESNSIVHDGTIWDYYFDHITEAEKKKQ